MKKLLILFALLALVGCSSSDKDDKTNEEVGTTPTPEVEDTKITYGSTFEFDGFEITIGDSAEIQTFESRFNDNNGKDMIVIPFNIKNNGEESSSINMFYVNYYNPDGTEAEDLNSYNDGLGWGGNLRSGSETTEYAYVLYVEDGEVVIEFSKPFGETIEVFLDVTK